MFLFDNIVNVNLLNLTMQHNKAYSDGGVLSIIKSDLSLIAESSITIKNCSNITENDAIDRGGFASV